MARAKRIIYAGNANGPDDFIPIVGGVANHAYPGGVRIPWWQGVDWRPTSAMTSNSAPSPFVVTRSSVYGSSYEAWKAFNKSYSDAYGWVTDSTDQTQPWITLKLDVPLKNIVTHVYNRTRDSLVNGWKTFYVDGSDDGVTWYQIGGWSGRDGVTSGAGSAHSCTNYNDHFQYVRWRVTDWDRRGASTNKYCAIGELYVTGKYGS